MATVSQLQKEIQSLKNIPRGKFLQRFFKTGKGEYAEGDIFYGIDVPTSRKLAKKYKDIPFEEISHILFSKIHEERLIALFILLLQFGKAEEKQKKKIIDFYLSSTQWINNWDLVDTSAYKILGTYLLEHDTKILYTLANSKNIWERRIAIISTFAFIKKGNLHHTFAIAERLLSDTHDLMHKAVGWMLREAGKRDRIPLEVFLEQHATHMPRTMLRYAIEKFAPHERSYYLKKK